MDNPEKLATYGT